MKKLIIISKEDEEYVWKIAKMVSDPRAKKGDFSKGLRLVIDDHRRNKLRDIELNEKRRK